jgi:hypothetical protein
MPRRSTQVSRTPQLDGHLDFQRREWRAQHVGWWALAVFLIASAGGAFGNGPLSRAHAGAATGDISLQYERFVRVGAEHRLVARVTSSGQPVPLELRINRQYLDRVRIDRVLPPPSHTSIGPEWATFRFDEGTTEVLVDCTPRESGRHSLALSVPSGGRLRVWQFAYF